MPTVIQLRTVMCPVTGCRWHCLVERAEEVSGRCPRHQEELQETTAPEDRITVTVRDASDFDDPTVIERGGARRFMTRADADEHDAAERQSHMDRSVAEAKQAGDKRAKATLVQEARDRWVAPTRVDLSPARRQALRGRCALRGQTLRDRGRRRLLRLRHHDLA